jgi:hypothetical protein
VPATTTTESLVVRPDRRRARVSLALNGVASAAALALLVRHAVVDDPSDLGWNVVFFLFWVGLMSYQLFTLARTLRADALLEVGPEGLRINDVGRGWVTLPWAAVGAVTRGRLIRGRVRVWPAPGLTWSTPGVVFPDQASFAKAKQGGFRIDTGTANVRSTDVLAAVERFRPSQP